MERKDKIKLLQDLSIGKVRIEDILPTKGRTWVQDSRDPFSFNCRDENLTRRLEEIPLTETENGFKITNVKIIANSTIHIIYQRMKEFGMLQ